MLDVRVSIWIGETIGVDIAMGRAQTGRIQLDESGGSVHGARRPVETAFLEVKGTGL
jgi:hypothetical protein